MAGRMAAQRAPAEAPPMPDEAMQAPGPEAGGSPEQMAQELGNLLAQAVMLTQQIGPEAFPQLSGPIWRGVFAQIDQMIAPMRQATGQGAGAPAAGGPQMAPQRPM